MYLTANLYKIVLNLHAFAARDAASKWQPLTVCVQMSLQAAEPMLRFCGRSSVMGI